ncbi:MAG: response regulator transcription factor [Elusimicrobiota bacterium]
MAKKVLVVDDDPEMVNLIKYSLEQGGFEVFSCDNGRMAMEEIRRVSPNLLVLDVMLPGVDGYSIQAAVSEDERLKNIPAIVLTALEPSRALFQKFSQVACFMTKPFKPEELLEAANAAIASSGKP